MAKILTKAGVTTGNTVEAFHVTQSIDAFTGIDAYDISLSGSFNMTGSINGEPGVTNPLTASYAITASYADNALSAINTPNAVITASNTGNDDTIEFLKGGGGAFSVTVNNVVSSSYAVTASYAENAGAGTNFANTDLTFTGNRTHFLNNNYLFITDTFIPTSSFLYLDVVAQETQIGLGNSYLSFDSTTIDFIQSGSSRVEINSTETIINGGGGNYDFRVKGDTDNVLLYVDASTDRVAIGKNTPNEKLDVNGNTIITGSLNNGSDNVSSGNFSHAEGQQTLASATGTHAEGTLTTASAANSHAEGAGSVANGSCSHAEGGYFSGPFVVRGGTTTGQGSHAEGVQTLASGLGSHAEGFQTTASGDYAHSEGNQTTASGDYAHSQGGNTQALGDYSLSCGAFSIAYKDYSTALGISFASGSIQTTLGINNIRSDNDLSSTGNIFIIGNGPLIGSPSNAFRVSGSGECFSGTTFTNGGADYAEYFESHDGKSIPLGTVVELTGSYIKVCETAENAIGVISNKPSILGNGDEGTGDQWVGMYLKDEWGNYLYESYTFEVPLKVDKDGNPITQKGTRKVLNPNYNPSQNYLPRATRPEWNVVGLLGQIKVLKNQNIPLRWIKMKDINDDIAIYLVK
jgi:trimeric autotransporter adhesin